MVLPPYGTVPTFNISFILENVNTKCGIDSIFFDFFCIATSFLKNNICIKLKKSEELELLVRTTAQGKLKKPSAFAALICN